MKVVHHTPTSLVLREGPWFFALFGALFATAGLYTLVTSTQIVLGSALTLIGVLIILFLCNRVTCTFDKTTGALTIERKGLLGTNFMQHPLSEIVGARITRGSSARSRTYRVELGLSSSERVPLTPDFSSGTRDKQEAIEAIRAFLHLPEA